MWARPSHPPSDSLRSRFSRSVLRTWYKLRRLGTSQVFEQIHCSSHPVRRHGDKWGRTGEWEQGRIGARGVRRAGEESVGGGISKRVGLRREKSFGNYTRMLNTVEPQNSNSDNSNSLLIRTKFSFPWSKCHWNLPRWLEFSANSNCLSFPFRVRFTAIVYCIS